MISREFTNTLFELVRLKECDGVRCNEWIIYGNFHLCENNLTHEDISLLSSLIIAHEPTTICLANLGINDDQLILLLNGIEKNTSVENIDLPFNAITEIGAQALANYLMKKECQIKRLIIFANKISNRGISAIASALIANTSLLELELFCNPFTQVVTYDFAKSLKANYSLEKLILFPPTGSMQLPDTIMRKLEANSLSRQRKTNRSRMFSLFTNGEKAKSMHPSLCSSHAIPTNSTTEEKCDHKLNHDNPRHGQAK